jgi:hypothetical protein
MAASRYHWNQSHPGLIELQRAIAPTRKAILAHRMYHQLDSLADVVTFMQHHVFAVWDFMSLLKNLQCNLTCVRVPWVPSGPMASRRLINEIVLVEESDELGDGYISHSELYVNGMAEAGADTGPVNSFLSHLREGIPVPQALASASAPSAAAEFVGTTWGILESAPIHCQAAAFAFSREDLIPDMFNRVIRIDDAHGKLGIFKDYLARHIEMDGEQHTPMAMQMLIDLCGDDADKWTECAKTVESALEARYTLWGAIAEAIGG